MAAWLLTTACNKHAKLPVALFMCTCLCAQPISAPWAPFILVEGSSISMPTSWDPWLSEVSWYVMVFHVDCIHVSLPTSSHVNVQDDFFMVKWFLFRLWVGSAAAVAIIHNEKIAFASARLGKCLLALWIVNHAWWIHVLVPQGQMDHWHRAQSNEESGEVWCATSIFVLLTKDWIDWISIWSAHSHRGLTSPGFICDPDKELSESERQKVQQAGPLLPSEVTCEKKTCVSFGSVRACKISHRGLGEHHSRYQIAVSRWLRTSGCM